MRGDYTHEDYRILDDLIKYNLEKTQFFFDHHKVSIIHDEERKSIEVKDISEAIRVINRKWVVELLWDLKQGGPKGFNSLNRDLHGISSRSLSQRLKDLNQLGLLERKVIADTPPRVQYTLSEKGHDVISLALPLIWYMIK